MVTRAGITIALWTPKATLSITASSATLRTSVRARRRVKAFLCLLAGALSCVSSSASTLIITSALDNGPGSLRATIAAAASGDVIQFDPSLNGQVILLASQVNVSRQLAIEGPGADKIAISGGNRTRILSVTAPLTPSGVTLKNGLGSGGALLVS